jgi:hypothetical protein
MLIPLVGFFVACAIFACVGVAVLAFIPRLRPTLVNLAVFVVGAVPSAAASAVAYGRIVGNEIGELNSVAVIGLFVVLLVVGLCAGLLSVLAYKWLMRVKRLHGDSEGPVSR